MSDIIQFKNLKRVLEDYGKNLVENYQRALADYGKNASGDLSKSVKYVIGDDKNGVFEVNLELLEYWKYIENGRKAGKMPPISAIEKWIEVKPVLPRPNKNGKLPTTKQLAYLIARKIGNEGILPRPILQERIEYSNDVFFRLIEEAIAEDLGTAMEIIFKEVGLS